MALKDHVNNLDSKIINMKRKAANKIGKVCSRTNKCATISDNLALLLMDSLKENL